MNLYLLDAALTYAARGWPVFPCGRNKRPRIPGGRGFLDATCDAAQLRVWWEKWPTALIGVAAGAASGIVVIDTDIPKTAEKPIPGLESLKQLEQKYGKLPETLTSRTGSGGHHLIFAHPGAGIVIPDKTELAGLQNLDVRGDGGYIIVPPSGHPSGGRYEWLNDLPIARLPDAWLELLMTRPDARRRDGGATFTSSSDAGNYWLSRALQSASEGNRNDRGFWLACQLRDAGLSERDAEHVMFDYAAQVPGSGYATREALASLKSAYSQAPRERGTGSRGAGANGATPQDGDGAASSPIQPDLRFRLDVDERNTERLIARYGQDLRWVAKWKRWIIWDGKRWAISESERVIKLAKRTIREIYAEAAKTEDDAERTLLVKHARKSDKISQYEAMERSARADLLISPDDLDRNPWLFNVENGTINLQTCELRPHRREDYITRIALITYDRMATYPHWEAFLALFFSGQEQVITYLQRMAGYCLTGDATEKAFFIGHGSGNNGKSTFINTLLALMGDYADQVATETLMMRRFDKTIANDIARLKGLRLVAAVEGEEGQRLATGKIKAMTGGGDKLIGEFKYGEEFSFAPTHKVFLGTNHRPIIPDSTDAMWDRVKLIPFGVTIEKAVRDPHYGDKLRAELPGILNWALTGCHSWQSQGLGTAPEVEQATAAYREAMDTIGQFIEECCTVQPAAHARSAKIYEAYTEWSKGNGETPFSQKRFSLALGEHGFKKEHTMEGQVWSGIGLIYKSPQDSDMTGMTGHDGLFNKIPLVKNEAETFSKNPSEPVIPVIPHCADHQPDLSDMSMEPPDREAQWLAIAEGEGSFRHRVEELQGAGMGYQEANELVKRVNDSRLAARESEAS